MQRFAIVDHGCRVNRYDGEVVRAELRRLGLREEEPADLLVLNACAVTDQAVRRGRAELRRMRRQRPAARLLVTGCMTDADEAGYRAVDPTIVTLRSRERAALRRGLEAACESEVALGEPSADADVTFDARTRAFLKVVDGCDSRCAFCVIPSIRGRVQSRPAAEIEAEARRLLDGGFREIVLCGIHLGHYGRDTGDALLPLVDRLAALPFDFRIRFGSLEATEVGTALGGAMRATPRLAPHLHVPLQSGDDAVLRAMRRPYRAADFLERLAQVRAEVPGLSVGTDAIVGFPGETEAAFERTLEVVAAAGFAKVHVFPYSARAGTPAAEMPGQVDAATIRRRAAALLRLERGLRRQADEKRIGGLARVLIQLEDPVRSWGLCERYRKVWIAGRHPWNRFVECRIVGRTGDDLLAEPA